MSPSGLDYIFILRYIHGLDIHGTGETIMGGKCLDPDYHRKYYLRNRERLIAAENARYRKARATKAGRAKLKRNREMGHFGYTHEEIFALLGDRCCRCGGSAVLVHHKHRDGRTLEKVKRKPGKDLAGLEVLCRACHINEHRPELLRVRAEKAASRWGKAHDGTVFSACICCGRSDIPYQGKGLCRNCHARMHRKSRACSL